MFKILRYLKPFIFSIFLVIVFLLIQASCDLSLPDYMSKIVNVGIQQGGIENGIPKVITEKSYDKIMIFLSDENKEKINDIYKKVSFENKGNNDYLNYIKEYPILESQNIYILNTTDKLKLDELNPIIAKALMVKSMIEKIPAQSLMAQMGISNPAILSNSNIDIFKLLGNMSNEQKGKFLEGIDTKLKDMQDSMIIQAATYVVKDEYKLIGINTDKLQSDYVIKMGMYMIALALISGITTVAVGFLAARTAAGLSTNLRKMVFEKVESFSSVEFNKFSTASLITRTTNDITQVQTLMMILLRMIFYAPIMGFGGVIKAMQTNSSMSWVIGVAVMALLSLVIILFVFGISKFKLIQKLVDKLNLVVRENLSGLLVVRAFNRQKLEEERFDKVNKDLTSVNLFVNRLMMFMMPAMMFIMNGVMLLIIWVGAHEIENATMQVGDMMAFMQYAMQIIMAFLMFSIVFIMIPRASVSANRIAEVIETEVAIKDIQNPKEFDKDVKGIVEFKDVSFKYEGAEDYVIKNISFIAKPGETTAIVGATGSGKSTIVKLIPRFYDIEKGEILVDGVNIKEVSQFELRKKIGYVPQKGVLFSGTIESNLKYGNPEASNETMEKMTNIAQATEFVSQAEEGYKKEISQEGTNVSGGQKQRLSIARALIKDSEIYIFDDSFSALDFRTDSNLRKALEKEIKDKTIIIVAQRISTIMNADNIIVLDKGKIVGMGTHNELMENSEVYSEIALSQLTEKEAANNG